MNLKEKRNKFFDWKWVKKIGEKVVLQDIETYFEVQEFCDKQFVFHKPKDSIFYFFTEIESGCCASKHRDSKNCLKLFEEFKKRVNKPELLIMIMKAKKEVKSRIDE